MVALPVEEKHGSAVIGKFFGGLNTQEHGAQSGGMS